MFKENSTLIQDVQKRSGALFWTSVHISCVMLISTQGPKLFFVPIFYCFFPQFLGLAPSKHTLLTRKDANQL